MEPRRHASYPNHLAKMVAERLSTYGDAVPAECVLLRLMETLYFASLKTDEARPCACTVNYIDPSADRQSMEDQDPSWSVVRFRQPLQLDVRSLRKLSEAADPAVSSLAVFSSPDGELYVWGMVDQELRCGDYMALDAIGDPQRPGLFQATITGAGGICVYKNFALLGSLEQHNLVTDYHDVLWEGPVYRRLRDNLHATLLDENPAADGGGAPDQVEKVKEELLVRWQNAVCRVLFNAQQYGHGGGILIVPRYPAPGVNVKYEQRYDRMPKSLFRLAERQILKRQTAGTIANHCESEAAMLPCSVHFDVIESQRELEQLKGELLGCARYIASLSRVDGFVLLDRCLVVHGFGVEARAEVELPDVFLAGDAAASEGQLRQVPISQFGTRHRAMMRYCAENDGAIGFVISQDGDIRATVKHRGQLVLWENINLQIAYRAENRGRLIPDFCPKSMTGTFRHWMQSLVGTQAGSNAGI